MANLKILFIDEESLKSFISTIDLSESGMDYYCVKDDIGEVNLDKKLFIIRGNGLVFPEDGGEDYYGINSLNKNIIIR